MKLQSQFNPWSQASPLDWGPYPQLPPFSRLSDHMKEAVAPPPPTALHAFQILSLLANYLHSLKTPLWGK